MAEQTKKMEPLSVRLWASEQSGHPRFANYTYVGIANEVACLDFGFIEPASLAGAARHAKNGSGAAKNLDGTAVSRVDMGLRVFQQLHRQINNIMITLKAKRPAKA
jgi:hypothetical protein